MINNRIFILISLGILSVVFIFLLAFYSEYQSKHNNGFIRMLPSQKIKGLYSIKLNGKNYYFAGQTEGSIFLANKSKPNSLLKVALGSRDTNRVIVTASNVLKLYPDARLIVDSMVYMVDGLMAKISIGSLNDFRLKTSINTPPFSDILPIRDSGFLIKIITKRAGTELIRLNFKKEIYRNRSLLKNQMENIFSSDGTLVKIPNTNRTLYTYYYQNRFLCINNDLTLAYASKTIDTVTRPQITVGSIERLHQKVISSPPNIVNKRTRVDGRYIYINSALRADNETDKSFKCHSAIDVYNVSDGHYLFSFYIPDFAGQKLTDFVVCDSFLIAKYADFLYTYKLNF